MAIYGVVDWAKTQSLKSIILAMLGFVGASFFHGASAIGAATFILYIGAFTIKEMFNSIKEFKIRLSHIVIVICFIIIIILYFSNYIYLPYIHDFEFISDPNTFMRKTRVSVIGTAAYPEWLIARSTIELFYKVPLRGFYFLFSPFPWDVKELKHLIGLFDAFLFIYLVSLIIRNFKTIWRDRALKLILLILVSYVIAFAVGVGNFGTGIRHRSKFVALFVLLVAPLINKFVFKKKSFKENLDN